MQDRMDGEQVSEVLGDKVMESLGVPESDAEVKASSEEGELPKFAKEKLGIQEKRHKKQVRMLQKQIDELRGHLTSRPEPASFQNSSNNSYAAQPNQQNGDPIQQAVAAALKARDDQERQAKEAEKMMHVKRQYDSFDQELDNASDKYDDFEDVVFDNNKPFTDHMKHAALLLPNRVDVLYKLGKNPDELKRISQLHPIDQAKELVKLSIAMMSGAGDKSPQQPKAMGNIKSNPVSNSSAQVSEKTPIGELRRKMREGWK